MNMPIKSMVELNNKFGYPESIGEIKTAHLLFSTTPKLAMYFFKIKCIWFMLLPE